jgi:hypothetical protein
MISLATLTVVRILGSVACCTAPGPSGISQGYCSTVANPFLCTPSALEDLINMLPAILVRRLKVLQLLSQIINIRLEVRCFGCQPLIHLDRRAENKPTN